jgi:hypothetical protein
MIVLRVCRFVRASALVATAVLLLLGLWSPDANADELTANDQATLLLRVLAYDRALASVQGDAIQVVVVFKNDSAAGAQKDLVSAFSTAARRVNVQGKRVEISTITYEKGSMLARLTSAHAAVAFLTPGLDNGMLDEIRAATRKLHALSLTGVEAYVGPGASVALVARGDRARVLVNLPATKEEGAVLDAALLNMAEVVK